MAEHRDSWLKADGKSALSTHSQHVPKWKEARVLCGEQQWFKRGVTEAAMIRKAREDGAAVADPPVNRNAGPELLEPYYAAIRARLPHFPH